MMYKKEKRYELQSRAISLCSLLSRQRVRLQDLLEVRRLEASLDPHCPVDPSVDRLAAVLAALQLRLPPAGKP